MLAELKAENERIKAEIAAIGKVVMKRSAVITWYCHPGSSIKQE